MQIAELKALTSAYPNIPTAEVVQTVLGLIPSWEGDELREQLADREIEDEFRKAVAAGAGKGYEAAVRVLDALQGQKAAADLHKEAQGKLLKLRKAHARLNGRGAEIRARVEEFSRLEAVRQVELATAAPDSESFKVCAYSDSNKAQAELASILTTIRVIAEQMQPRVVAEVTSLEIEAMLREGETFTAYADFVDLVTSERLQSAGVIQAGNLAVDTSTGRSGALRRKAKDLLNAANARKYSPK